jgi:hypothetical protein
LIHSPIYLTKSMAFLVCYSLPHKDHVRNRAIYLDQQFYELIFENCRSENEAYPLLRKIALLNYKSPTLIIETHHLVAFEQELARFELLNLGHPQIEEFKSVCGKARSDGYGLTISGDMYPEL